jgi:hypothetical protein
MPKDKTSIRSKLNEIIKKYPKELEIVSNKLMCKLCLKEISFTHKHMETIILLNILRPVNIEKRRKSMNQLKSSLKTLSKKQKIIISKTNFSPI